MNFKPIKQWAAVILLTIGQLSVFSQSNYTFTSSFEEYHSISGTEVNIDEYSSIDIGFSFNFNGINYTQVIPSESGWLSFNPGVSSFGSSLTDGNLTNTTGRPLIGAIYCNNGTIASSNARYLVSGTAPDRVFTFEWYDWKWHWYTTHRISFQVKLYETSNKIELCYHPIYFDDTFYSTTSIGLAFENAGDFLSLSNFSTSPSVSTEVESHDFFSAPVDNLKYTFELNPLLPEPTNQCTNLSTSIVSDNVFISWDEATGVVIPDGYLLMASTDNAFVDPIDGTNITADNDLSDESGVVKVLKGQKSYLGWKNIASSTNYFFKVFAYTNSGDLVDYNTSAAPTTSAYVLKSQPNKHVNPFTVKNIGGNFVFDWKDVSRFGNALRINYNETYHNLSSYIDCGSNPSLNITGNAITLEAWVNPFKTGGSLFQKENSTLDGGYRMYINGSGQLCFDLYIDGSWSSLQTTANILPIYTWSHICGTYDGTVQRIYINGVLHSSKASTGNITTSTTNLFIGRDHTPDLSTFDGKIDEIAIWSTSRSQPEILNDINLKIAGTETGLVVYYNCNQGVADDNTGVNDGLTTLYDATSNAINANLVNFLYYDANGYTASNTNSETDGYLLLATSTNAFPIVVNGNDFAEDNNLSDGSGAVKVFQGVQTYNEWINTNLSQTYSFRIYPYANIGSEILYNTAETIPEITIKPEPTNHVEGFEASSVQCNVVLTWTDAVGEQIPDGYLILASKTGTFTTPTDGVELSVDKNLADGSGTVKVLAGVQTFSEWTGFESGVNYYFTIYSYTNSGLTINYKTDGTLPQSNSSITLYSEPTFHATNFTAKNSGTLELNWSDAFDMKNCLIFDGIDDYISCGTQNSSLFTFETWVNPSIVNADQAIISTLNEGGLTGCELHINASGKPVLTINSSGSWVDIISSTDVIANTWIHLAATYDGTTALLYINGVQVASQATSSFIQGTNSLVIGRRSSGLLNFKGKIDDVRIWNDVRTVSEITSNMNSELLGTEPGLTSYYKFNQGNAAESNSGITTLTDATANNWTGSLSNFNLTGTESNWVKATQTPDGYLIKASTTNSISDPVDFTSIPIDNNLLDGAGIVKVSNGIQSYSDWTGLKSQTTYYFKIYSLTNEGNYTDYKTIPAAPETSVAFVKSRPITHVTNLAATHYDKVININWTDAVDGTPSFENAIDLDGTDDYISIPAIESSLSAFTVETWLNFNAIIAEAGIYNTNSWAPNDFHLQIWNNNTIEFALNGNDPLTSQALFPFEVDKWYHLAVSYNSATDKVKFYVNGLLIQTITLNSSVTANLTEAQIGAWVTSRYFNGKLDEYRIWNAERSQSEIFSNMYSELSGTETGLLLYYKFNQGIAEGDNAGISTVTDISPNAKNGSLLNCSLTGNNSNWVNTGNIDQKVAAPDGYLIKASKNSNITSPVDGLDIADDVNLSDDLGSINVLQGVQSYNGWTNANDTSKYYFKVFPYNNSGTAKVYNTNPTIPTVTDSTGIKQFKDVSTNMHNFTQGTSAWADYNGDGLLDVLVAGGEEFYTQPQAGCLQYNGAKASPSILYTQNILHEFDSTYSFPSVIDASIAWADYNNDSLVDFILTGKDNTAGVLLGEALTKLYKQEADSSFTEVSGTGIRNVCGGGVAWADYDNDGDLDVLIAGNSDSGPVSLIYQNNGDGTFSEQTEILLPGINNGTVAWGDYNNDGLVDIILAGYSGQKITKIYKNNGNNSFSEQTAISLPGIAYGTVSWNDYDNDGYLDILISGDTDTGSAWSPFTGLYKNNRAGNFVAQTITDLENLSIVSTAWGDYNNDGLSDFVISGYNGSAPQTLLYEQDSNHSFIKRNDFGLAQLDNSSINLIDYNNDGTLDVFITGQYPVQECPSCCINFSPSTKLYKNTHFKKNTKPSKPSGLGYSLGNKVLLYWQPSTDLETSAKALSYNLRIGTTSSGSEIVSPAANDGGFIKIPEIGNCQLDTSVQLNLKVGLTYYWSVQAIDNGYLGSEFSVIDTFYNDSIPSSNLSLKVLNPNSVKADWSRGNGSRCAVFVKMKYDDASLEAATPVHGTLYTSDSEFRQGHKIGTTGWYCVYNGRNESVTITGLEADSYYAIDVVEYVEDPTGPRYYKYLSPNNDNRGIFNTDSYLEQDLAGAQCFGDFNNDSLIDIISTNGILHLSKGDNSFTERTAFSSLSVTHMASADYNNDGYLDLIVSGSVTVSPTKDSSFTKLYQNNHDSTFIEQTDITIDGVYRGSLAWGDYDNDGDMDLLICGTKEARSTNKSITQIYTNNFPSNSFTLLENTNFEGIDRGTAAWADYDNDGYLDFVMAGQINITYEEFVTIGCKTTAELYHNNKDGSFTAVTSVNLVGAYNYPQKTCYWNDYDGDGDIDLKIEGTNTCSGMVYQSIIYQNNFPETNLTNIYESIPFFDFSNKVDFDNDGDLDIIEDGSINRNTTNYFIGNFDKNKKPEIPTNYTYRNKPGFVELSWDKVSTDETPDSLMFYNVRFRKVGTSKWLGASHSLDTGDLDGYHKNMDFGNVRYNNFARYSLQDTLYEWQVQTIDGAYSGSPWSPILQFEVKAALAKFSADTVCLGNATNFIDNSFAYDGIVGWQWDFGDTSSVSTLQNPTHVYQYPGEHLVRLVVANTTGKTDTIFNNIRVNPVPMVTFNANDVCEGTTTSINTTTVDNGLTITSWKWNFGDEQTSEYANPASHVYTSMGNYTITLEVIANNFCSTSVSKNIVVTTTPNTNLTLDYGNPSFCMGDSVIYSVQDSSIYDYKWLRNGELIDETSNTLKVKDISGTYKVNIINTLSSACSASSAEKTIEVKPVPVSPIIDNTSSSTFCSGDSILLQTTFQDGIDWLINGISTGISTDKLYAKTGGIYSIRVTNSNLCETLSANTVGLTMNQLPILPTVSAGETTVCQGEQVSISVVNNSSINYQWYKNEEPITDAIGNLFLATETGTYKLLLSNTNCSIYTDPIAVTVNPTPTSPLIGQPATNAFCNGDSVLLQTTFQDGMDWLINGVSTGISTDKLYAKTGGNFSIKVTNSSLCETLSANTVGLTMNQLPILPTVSAGETTVCQGEKVSISVVNNSSINYQWYKNEEPITDATGNLFLATETGTYKLLLSNTANCSIYTDPIAITVNPTPTSPLIEQPATNAFCNGDSILLQTTFQDGMDWLINGIRTGISTDKIYAKNSGTYTLLIVNEFGCNSESSNAVTMTMNPSPSLPSISYGNTSICEQQSVTFTVNSTFPSYNYQWQKNNSAIEGATTSSYTAWEAGEYSLSITNANLCSVKTTPIPVIVNEMPTKPIIEETSNNTLFCPGTNVELRVTIPATNYNYQWKRSGVDIAGANESTYRGKLTAGDYKIEAKIGECSVESDVLTLNTKPAPNKPQIYARGPNVWTLACNNMSATDYRWFYNDQLVLGAKTYVYVANHNLGNYYVEISEGGECYTMSDIINIPSGEIISDVTDLLSDDVTIYPNPTTTYFNVDLGGKLSGMVNVDIIDAMGKSILHFQYQDISAFSVDISNLSSGIYFCKIQHKTNFLVKKIIKK